MTTLLSVSFAALLTVSVGILLLALVVATVLLLLLALLALDVLLERNGVDRRAGVGRLWDRLRRPEPIPGRAAGDHGDVSSPAPRAAGHGHQDGADARIPFSARRPFRAPHAPEPAADPSVEAGPSGTAVSGQAQAEPVAPQATAADSPTPAADAVTEVLAVEIPPAPRARPVRAPRSAPARPTDPAPPAGAAAPADRDSAIDRLFAPLLDSDTTEPLPTPRAARPARKPRDQG